MKTLLKLSFLLVAIWLSSCSQSSETTDNRNSTIESEDQADLTAYDSSKDLSVTGGESIEILGDTLGIKMYIATMEPGDSVAWHFHPDHTVYVMEGGTLAVYFEEMDKQVMELPTGVGFISPPLSDAAVNIGNTTIKMLTHDIYRPRNE